MNFIKINKILLLGLPDNLTDNSQQLKEAGIQVVINCASEIEYTLDDLVPPVRLIHYRVRKDSISYLENVHTIVNKIRYYESVGKVVYLHCDESYCRSASIIIFYLIMHKGFTYDKAYNYLIKLKPEIEIDEEFEAALRIIDE
jgi:protein-tyrosine phosphatase